MEGGSEGGVCFGCVFIMYEGRLGKGIDRRRDASKRKKERKKEKTSKTHFVFNFPCVSGVCRTFLCSIIMWLLVFCLLCGDQNEAFVLPSLPPSSSHPPQHMQYLLIKLGQARGLFVSITASHHQRQSHLSRKPLDALLWTSPRQHHAHSPAFTRIHPLTRI